MSNAGQTTAMFAAEDYKGSTGYNQEDVLQLAIGLLVLITPIFIRYI